MQKYINNISALQVTKLLRFLNLFLIGVVFARLFSVNEIGYYEKFIFIAGIVSFFWLQGVLQSFLSLVKQKTDNNKSVIYFNTFILLIAFSVFTVILLWVFKNTYAKHIQSQIFSNYFKWLVLYILLSVPASMTEYVYLGLNKSKNIIAYGTVSHGLHFLFVVIPALLNLGLEFSLIALVSINLLRLFWLIGVLYKHTLCKLSFSFIKQHIKIAYPLIISALLSGSSQYIDGFLVSHFYSSSQFAIFRFGARELPLAIILCNAFSNAMLPEFSANTLKTSVNKIKKYSNRLLHLLFPITFILMIISNLLFPIVFSNNFMFSAKIFNVYLLLIIFRILFPHTILIGMQKTKLFLWVSAIELTANALFSLIFMQFWGLLGIAYATIIAYGLEKVILIGLVKKHYKINLNAYLSIKYYAIYSIILIITYIVTDYLIF